MTQKKKKIQSTLLMDTLPHWTARVVCCLSFAPFSLLSIGRTSLEDRHIDGASLKGVCIRESWLWKKKLNKIMYIDVKIMHH